MVDVRNYFEAHDLDRPQLLESESRKAEGQGRYSRYDDIIPDQAKGHAQTVAKEPYQSESLCRTSSADLLSRD